MEMNEFHIETNEIIKHNCLRFATPADPTWRLVAWWVRFYGGNLCGNLLTGDWGNLGGNIAGNLGEHLGEPLGESLRQTVVEHLGAHRGESLRESLAGTSREPLGQHLGEDLGDHLGDLWGTSGVAL